MRGLLIACCLTALNAVGAEPSDVWTLEAPAAGTPPGLKIPVSMDLAFAKGISFDWKCDDVSRIERVLIYLKDKAGTYGYTLKPQTRPGTEWSRVSVEKSDIVGARREATGFREVVELQFYCARREEGTFRFSVRNFKVEPTAEPVMALLMIDAGVERRQKGDISKMFYLELGQAQNDLWEYGLESVIVSERDLVERDFPPSVKIVWLPWKDRSVSATQERLTAFKARGGKVLVARRKNVGDLRARLVKMAPEMSERMETAKVARERAAKAKDDEATAYPSKAGELRDLSCHDAWGPKGPWTDWDAAARFAAENGITQLSVNFCRGPFASYASDVLLPWPVEAKRQQGDAFELCRAACRKYGLGLVAWRVCWQVPEWLAPKEVTERLRAAGRFQKSFDGQEKDWLCPSHPENVRQEIEAAVELAKKGGLKGIDLDYIRYPGEDFCFCGTCRSAFEKKIGHAVTHWPQDVRSDKTLAAAWTEFRKENIARVVRRVAERVHAEAPGVKVQVSGFELPEKAAVAVGQDWPAWCRAGWVDVVGPMTYRSSKTDYRDTVRMQKKQDIGKAKMCPMIGPSCWRPVGDDALRIAEQVEVLREEGFDGFGIFAYGERTARFLPPLGRGPFKLK